MALLLIFTGLSGYHLISPPNGTSLAGTIASNSDLSPSIVLSSKSTIFENTPTQSGINLTGLLEVLTTVISVGRFSHSDSSSVIVTFLPVTPPF